MIVGILTTDGGPHTVSDLAYASASMMLSALRVDPNSPNRARLEMMQDDIRPKLADVLVKHHEAVQNIERQKLAAGDHSRLMAPLDAAEHTDIDQAVADCVALVAPLLANNAMVFSGGEVSNDPAVLLAHLTRIVRERIETDIRTNMHIERSWHADRNQGTVHAAAFRAAHHGAGIV